MTKVLVDSKSDSKLIEMIHWCYDTVDEVSGPSGGWDWDFVRTSDKRVANIPWEIRKNMINFTFKSKEWATIFSLKWL